MHSAVIVAKSLLKNQYVAEGKRQKNLFADSN